MIAHLKDSVNPISARLMLSLGYLQELHTSLDIYDVMENTLDSVLKITGLDRAYGFLVEDSGDGELDLKQVGARRAGGDNIHEDSYTISQSLLMEVIEGDGSIILEDADNGSSSSRQSVQDFKITTVVCIPLIYFNPETSERVFQGVVYADQLLAKNDLPAHCRSTLQLLSQMVSGEIHKALKYEEVKKEAASYQIYMEGIATELETISTNVLAIENKCIDLPHNDLSERYLRLLESQAESLHKIAESLQKSA